MTVESFLRRKGYTLAGSGRSSSLTLWQEWYKGYVSAFHKYRVRCGRRMRDATRYSLGMAKIIAEDFGSLLVNEHVQVVCDSFPALDDILQRNQWHTRMNRLAELTMAQGTGAVVEFNAADGPTIDYIPAELIYPLRWDGEVVTDCAFASKRLVGEGDNTREGYYVQLHSKEPNGWKLRNYIIDSSGAEQPLPDGMLDESPVSPVPLFQLVRPNTVNAADPFGPMGASVFAGALDQLKACDIIYDSYINEFVLGKKRLMVPMSMATAIVGESGQVETFFDDSDMLIYSYIDSGSADNPVKLTEIDMHLRTQEHEQGLQRQIDMLSKKCGLGTGRYRFDGEGMKTATEVISEKSDLYQSIKRHEKTFGDAIIGMVKALSWLSGGSPDVDVTVNFDDSIIEDTNANVDRVIKLQTAGLMSRKDAIMAIYKVDEAEADRRLAAIKGEEAVNTENVSAFFDQGEGDAT